MYPPNTTTLPHWEGADEIADGMSSLGHAITAPWHEWVRRNSVASWLNDEFVHPGGDVPRRVRTPFGRKYRAVIAEFFGTLSFVFFATGAVVIAAKLDHSNPPSVTSNLFVAFAQGFSLAVAIYSIAHVSGGHCNPAVTFALIVVRRIGLITGFFYIIAQLGGGIIASLFVKSITSFPLQGNLGATTLGATSVGPGYWIEVILTYVLVSTVFATAIDRVGFGILAPLAIGLSVFLDLVIGFTTTGGSMNPARSFGPAVIANQWSNHWIYWIGPLTGAVVAAFVQDLIFRSRPSLEPTVGVRTEGTLAPRPVTAPLPPYRVYPS